MTISPVYDPSVYRELVETEHPGKLFEGWLPECRAPGEYRIYGDLAAAQAPSSAKEMADLQAEARSRAWREAGPPWLDITTWTHLSVALLYIGYLSAAKKAGQSGNMQDVLSHDEHAAAVRAAATRGNAAAMNYLRKQAGHARLGGHTDLAGRDNYELGRWEDAHEWMTGVSMQLLDRDTGNPRLHAHNLVLNLVQARPSGEWGRLDLRGLEREQYMAAVYGRVAIEQAMSRDLGVAWEERADRNGREIAGISEETMQAFSSPRQAAPRSVTEHKQPAEASDRISLQDELKRMGWLGGN